MAIQSGLDEAGLDCLERFKAFIKPWYIISTVDDSEPRFTWSFALYGGDAQGGEVIDYIAHRIVRSRQSALARQLDYIKRQRFLMDLLDAARERHAPNWRGDYLGGERPPRAYHEAAYLLGFHPLTEAEIKTRRIQLTRTESEAPERAKSAPIWREITEQLR